MIENWPSSALAAKYPGSNAAGFIVSTRTDNAARNPPAVVLSSPELPSNYQLSLTFGTDGEGNVISVTFNAYDNEGNQLFQNPNTVDLYDLYTITHSPVGPGDVSPVLAVQVNLVGDYTGRTVFASGAGKITYSSTAQPLSALPQAPNWLGFQFGTYETSNSVYADMQSGDSFTLTQPFAVATFTPGQALAATRQFGTSNRTDVFAIGSTGQLFLFYVEDSGDWHWHTPIGPGTFPPIGAMFAPAGAQLAVSRQFGLANRTDVFVVDNNGTLNVFYCDNGDTAGWQGPLPISAAGFAPPGAYLAACQRAANANQTDVYVVDNTGTLNVFSVVSDGTWSGPVPISAVGFAPKGAAVAASPRYGMANQTDVYLAETSGAMNVFSVGSSGEWGGPSVISQPGFEAPPWATIVAAPRAGVANRTDVYVTDHNGQLTVFSWLESTIPLPPIFRPAWVTTLIGPSLNPTGSAAPFPNGAPIAVSPQFGTTNQTDVFIVDIVGALHVFWVEADGAWNGPTALSNTSPNQALLDVPAGSFMVATAQFGATGQTDVFMINSLTPQQSPGVGWPCVFWVNDGGSWNGPASPGLQV